MALLEASAVRVAIRGKQILHGAEISVDAGEVVALLGPNGAGKSTFARALAGLQPFSAGMITWDTKPVGKLKAREMARLRAFVPQRAPVPVGVTVREAVAIGRAPHLGMLDRPTRSDRAIVEGALQRVGVAGFADRMLPTLSGGELQRVRVAIALAQDAPCVVLDEPTASLDLGAAAVIGQLLRGMAADGLAVLVVLHDLALAAAIADRVVVMNHGRTVAHGAPADVLSRDTLASIWHVDADLSVSGDGTALTVNWLAPTPGDPVAPGPVVPAQEAIR